VMVLEMSEGTSSSHQLFTAIRASTDALFSLVSQAPSLDSLSSCFPIDRTVSKIMLESQEKRIF
jgi:hypothetical protein